MALPPFEQKLILKFLKENLGKSEEILEKDVWICWALNKLFTMPNAPQMAFKGGTSFKSL